MANCVADDPEITARIAARAVRRLDLDSNEDLAYIKVMPTDGDAGSLREVPVPYSPPPETQRLIDELYREELLEARRMAPEEKILAGQRLFEAACRITLAGIRNQFPDASDERCRQILKERLELQRRLEETS